MLGDKDGGNVILFVLCRFFLRLSLKLCRPIRDCCRGINISVSKSAISVGIVVLETVFDVSFSVLLISVSSPGPAVFDLGPTRV